MTALFPKSPAKVNLHLLPSNADFISYRFFDGFFKLKAWMPAGVSISTFQADNTTNYNNFFSTHCFSCPRSDNEYYDNVYGDSNNVPAAEQNGECCVHHYGYNGQACPLNHDSGPEEESTSVSNTVIEVALNHLGDPPRFKVIEDYDNAHLCAGYVDENNNIYSTPALRSANVFGGDNVIGSNICWGDNEKPNNLREAALSYLGSRFNSDLLRITNFISHNKEIESYKAQNKYSLNTKDKFMCSGYEALMIVDAQTDVQAFFTLLMAGFRPMEEIPHAIIVPIEQSAITRGESLFFGYTTPEDATGRKWYVSSEGFLIGQLNETFSCTRHR
jgi:hypothetical protein